MGGGERHHQIPSPCQKPLARTTGRRKLTGKHLSRFDGKILALGGDRLGKNLLTVVLRPVAQSLQFRSLPGKLPPETLKGTDADRSAEGAALTLTPKLSGDCHGIAGKGGRLHPEAGGSNRGRVGKRLVGDRLING